MKRAIFIHGWGGFPEEGWRPWLKEQLEQAGWQVVNPAMPDTDTPTQDKWLAKLSEVIGEPDDETYLIGHSLGGITILRYLESLPQGKTIGGAVLIAGFANDLTYNGYKCELASFFGSPVNWETIKAHCPQFFALYSKGDSWVDEANYHELKEKLHAQGVLQDGFKHYSGDDGITELPIVLTTLEEMAR
jgi:predicted alpha/beta hydrolase family esterase